MTVGDIIAALAKCCAYYDDLLLCKSVWEINVCGENEDCLEVVFCDGNTADITINIDGEII